ncbi:MAG: hypothetical protein AAB676_07805 [Verrucomicrobiota bacterium]
MKNEEVAEAGTPKDTTLRWIADGRFEMAEAIRASADGQFKARETGGQIEWVAPASRG